MSAAHDDPTALLGRSLASDRVHSAYLLSGAGEPPRRAAEVFARALACESPSGQGLACESCRGCRRSRPLDEIVSLSRDGKRGPFFRHIGEHPDLFWVERGADDTRVSIGQVRALQAALRLGANEGGRRVAVIADAEWLNDAAKNALLRLLEEPPPRTTLLLVARRAAALLATIRSRCVRVPFPAEEPVRLRGEDVDAPTAALVARFDAISGCGLVELLDWAEEYRGARAEAAEQVEALLAVGSEWLRERIRAGAAAGSRDLRPALDAHQVLSACRKDLAQRNANPQMTAERSLFAVREAAAR